MRQIRASRSIAFRSVAALLLAPLIVVHVAAQAPAARTQQVTLADLSASIEDLAQTASPAVVQITVRSRTPVENGESGRAGFVSNRETSGSGIIVDSDGYVVTNAHALTGQPYRTCEPG
jgi:S1-C subfamily serine protease